MIKLEDLVPQDSEITIGGKTYGLRKMNVEDESWMRTVFGKDTERIFSEMDFRQISKLIFRLLKEKTDFLPIKEKSYDDNGYEVEIQVSAPERIMRALSGSKEKLDAYYSLVECIGLSRPLLDKIAEEELKKNEIASKIVTEMSQTGETSLTASQASTATP